MSFELDGVHFLMVLAGVLDVYFGYLESWLRERPDAFGRLDLDRLPKD